MTAPVLVPSGELCAELAERHETVILQFSGGKDSVAAWLQCKRYFGRVVPFYMAYVPDLQFVERTLRYYEAAFATPIYRVLHPSFWDWLRRLVFVAPPQLRVIERARWPSPTFDTIRADVKRDHGLPPDTLVATGVRLKESLLRKVAIKSQGALPRDGQFRCIWDWSAGDVYDAVEEAGLDLAVDYRMHGRSFDAIHGWWLTAVKQWFPDDYERICNWFPLAEAEVLRHEWFDIPKKESGCGAVRRFPCRAGQGADHGGAGRLP